MSGWKRPTAQSTHSAAAAAGWYAPLRHDVHERAATVPANFPGGHSMQKPTMVPNFPAGHWRRQTVALAAELPALFASSHVYRPCALAGPLMSGGSVSVRPVASGISRFAVPAAAAALAAAAPAPAPAPAPVPAVASQPLPSSKNHCVVVTLARPAVATLHSSVSDRPASNRPSVAAAAVAASTSDAFHTPPLACSSRTTGGVFTATSTTCDTSEPM